MSGSSEPDGADFPDNVMRQSPSFPAHDAASDRRNQTLGRPTSGVETSTTPAQDTFAAEIVQIVSELSLELHPQRGVRAVHDLDSDLDLDFGLDSLGRAELFLRLEHSYGRSLPEGLIGAARTPRDLMIALQQAGGTPTGHAFIAPRPMAVGTSAAVSRVIDTLPAVLDWHAVHSPDRPHLVLSNGEDEQAPITFAELARSSRIRGYAMRQAGLEPGERVAIMLPTSRAFFEVFMGALYSGAITVPVYPPTRLDRLEEHLRRLAGILANSEASILIIVPEARGLARLVRSLVPSLKSVLTVADLETADVELPGVVPSADSTALLQYTSGSTGDPKGVVLTHQNILANIQAMGGALQASELDVFVSWLPVYHDMGLIGAWLACLYYAAPSVIMSPLHFLARPQRWLWTMHRMRATISAAPNFAFELCAEQLRESDLAGLDLSSLRALVNGSEPVGAATVRRFVERFQKYGLRPEAVAPAYGLAECAVALTLPPRDRPPRIDRIKSETFALWRRAAPAADDDSSALEIVACGQPLPRHEVRIIDDTGHELPERQEGRLQFRGPSATSGYFHNPEKTRGLFDGSWLDSGDLAYSAEGDIFITGRTKDIIIRGGRHIHPNEIEQALCRIPGVERGGAVLLGVPDPHTASEQLVAIVETRLTLSHEREKLRAAIEERVADLAATPPDDIVLAPPHNIPRTPGGKIRRLAARENYAAGRAAAAPRARRSQLMRLRLSAIAPTMRRALTILRAWFYAGYWWFVLGAFAVVMWPLIVILPRLSWRWGTMHAAARLMLRLQGIRLSVDLEIEPPLGDAIIVVNHSSFIDAAVLTAALPGCPIYAAKREFKSSFFIGTFLKRLGALFVERFEPKTGVEDTRRASALAREGGLLVFFPEATFTRLPGLAEFRLGAFLVAAETGRPIVPVVLRGTRSVLRAGQWFPRRNRLFLHVAAAIPAEGDDFAAAIRLRDKVRAKILARCGEPDLAPASGRG